MNAVIRKIGNSDGLIIPREMLVRLDLKTGDRVNLVVTDGELRLVPGNDDLDAELAAAREGMAKYRTALRELAK